uniref:Transmembrane protein n=1 Tax=Panagrolaimus sp. ES5 TaxID=591445 RepID=A0AC34F679_9BILA
MGSLIDNFAVDHDQKLAFKIASYNSMFVILLAICFAGLFAIYNMLYMFLMPILWATLVGTVLFPLKKRISQCFGGWLENLDRTDTPLVVGLIFLPYNYTVTTSDTIFRFFYSRLGAYFIGAYFLLKVLSYKRAFMVLLSYIGSMYQCIDCVIDFMTESKVFITMMILYSAAYGGWLYVQVPGTVHKKFARSLSLPIWVFVVAYISSFFGPLRVMSFSLSAATLILISVGFIGSNTDTPPPSPPVSPNTTQDSFLQPEEDFKDATDAHLEHKIDENPSGAPKDINNGPEFEAAVSGDTHIQIIFALCVLIWLVRHDSMLFLIFIPLIIALFRQMNAKLGINESIKEFRRSMWEKCGEQVNYMIQIVVAGPLRKFVKLLFTSDRIFVTSLRTKVDLISSIAVMGLLALLTVFMFLFTAFQLQQETVHLVKLGSDVVSTNPQWLKYARNYTEEQLSEHDIDIDNYVEKAYQQGRAWLASNIRRLADPKDDERANELEDQAKFLVDNLYRLWEERSIANSVNSSSHAVVSQSDWVDHLTTPTNLESLKGEITNIISSNIDTVLSIAQSLWGVVLLNVSLISTVLGSVLGLILGFGLDLLSFFIEIIVFLSVVYYLLANSYDRWLPLTWIDLVTRTIMGRNATEEVEKEDVDDGAHITSAIEESIQSVFVLSAKMAVFWGLYTCFIHSLFDLNVIFIPSIMAACLAATPIVPPYSVLIFGAVELYLIRGEMAAGIVFTLMSIAPLMFADIAFYREVKNSHPYVTGLSVIGGIYWLGFQGAIFGPIILCTMLALFNVYIQFAKTS